MKNKRIIVSWLLLIVWMIFIFYMSNQPASVSNSQSDLLIKVLNSIGIDLNSYFGTVASFVVRKAAHITEYFILYLLSINVMKNYIEMSKAKLYGLLIVLGYAFTDEIHQYFVPGRAMAFRDVLIDFSGGIIGFIIQSIYYKFKNKFKRNYGFR